MSQNNVIPAQKVNAAAAGDQEAMREILHALVNTGTLGTNVQNTAPGKNVPPQATASVSYLQQNYVVQILNPGAVAPTSALQSAQAAAVATQATVTTNVTAIYHQIRVATSPGFNIASNVQTFGGDTGSTQTYWTLTGLGSGRFYFQVRSSYDGVNWNLWRNANGGQTITQNVDGVTTENVTNAVWAAFVLPGDLLVAFGSGFVADGGTFDVATDLYTSAMMAIPGMNGVQQTGNDAHGIEHNSISISVPTIPQALTGPADYPTVVAQVYRDSLSSGHFWTGSANIFGFAYDPLGTNILEWVTSQGNWISITLPGGAQIVVGSGVVPNASTIVPPTAAECIVPKNSVVPVPAAGLSWIDATNLLGIATPNNAFSGANHAHGVVKSGFVGMDVFGVFQDGSGNQWAISVNWFAAAFSPGFPFVTLTDGRFAVFTLPGGTKVALGQGLTASGSSFTLPPGFTSDYSLSIGVPAGFNDSGHPMTGVAQCSVIGTLCVLQYTDGSGNYWDGQVSWMCFAWIP